MDIHTTTACGPDNNSRYQRNQRCLLFLAFGISSFCVFPRGGIANCAAFASSPSFFLLFPSFLFSISHSLTPSVSPGFFSSLFPPPALLLHSLFLYSLFFFLHRAVLAVCCLFFFVLFRSRWRGFALPHLGSISLFILQSRELVSFHGLSFSTGRQRQQWRMPEWKIEQPSFLLERTLTGAFYRYTLFVGCVSDAISRRTCCKYNCGQILDIIQIENILCEKIVSVKRLAL